MTKCMEKYRNDFAIKFAQIMQEKLPKWKNFQNEERKSLYSLGAFGGYFATALLGFLPGKNEHDYDIKFHCWIAVALFIAAIITNIHITNKTYQNRVKRTFFDDILKVFGENIFYSNGLSYGKAKFSREVPNTLINTSQLFSRNIEVRNDDDRFYGEYNGVPFSINETDFGYNVKTSKGTRYECMFAGIAMFFKMKKQIKSRVLIMSKGFWNKVPKNYEKVELEYNKFSKKYNVYVDKNAAQGSGQIEARYLLNAAFLDRFVQLQTSFRVSKIACSIYNDNMLVMLSTGRDLFEMNHLLGKIDDIKQYKHLFDEFASVLSFMDVLNLASNTKL